MISSILLGAGESIRMGFDKLSLPFGKKSILEQCFHHLLRSQVKEVIVVLGPHNKKMGGLFQGQNVKVLVNPYSNRGMSSSIRRGIQSIQPKSKGILIALGDQPLLQTRTINALIRVFKQGRKGIVVPLYLGRRGHPVIFHHRYKKELMNLRGDAGGKSVMDQHPEDIQMVLVKSAGVVKDIDTWQDYEKEVLKRELRNKNGDGRKRH